MENDRSEISSFVGTASEQAGRVVGHIAAFSRKITGFGAGMASAGKGVLGLAEDDIKHVPKKASDNTKAVASSSDVRAAQKKLAEVQKQSQEKESQLESQLQAMQKKNNSLISELEQAVSQAKETSACEGAARARVAALELELDAAGRQLEEARSQGGSDKSRKPARAGTKAQMEEELTATQHKMAAIQDQAQKAQDQFESQLKELQAEKASLLSELETAKRGAEEADGIANRVHALTEQVRGLESELDATRAELAESRSQAESAQTELTSQLEALRLDKDSLTFDMQVAQGQAESAQAELTSQLEALRSERDSLTTDLQIAQRRADEAKARENVLEKQVALLKSKVTGLHGELASAYDSIRESDAVQAEEQVDFSEQVEFSREGTLLQGRPEESIGVNVENVEDPGLESILESEVATYTEEMEPMQAVESAGTAGVTTEDVQAADFKNGTQRILFTKALSDFGSPDPAMRADAAAVIVSIGHELSPKAVIAHLANESSEHVRQECIKALSSRESEEGLLAIERA